MGKMHKSWKRQDATFKCWGSRSIQSAGSNPAFEVRRLGRLTENLTGEVWVKSENINGDQVVLISACPAFHNAKRSYTPYRSMINGYITMLLIPRSTTLAPYHNYLVLPSGYDLLFFFNL